MPEHIKRRWLLTLPAFAYHLRSIANCGRRCHARTLTDPAQCRHAISYVLYHQRDHAEGRVIRWDEWIGCRQCQPLKAR